MLIEELHGVPVEKREKTFEDGGKGWFVVLLLPDGAMVNCWLPSGVKGAEELKEVDCKEFRNDCAGLFRVAKRIWEGDIKRRIVDFSI